MPGSEGARLGLGVSEEAGRHLPFRARIQHNKRTIFLGRFETSHEAELAYDVAARMLGKKRTNHEPPCGYRNAAVERRVQEAAASSEAGGGGASDTAPCAQAVLPPPPPAAATAGAGEASAADLASDVLLPLPPFLADVSSSEEGQPDTFFGLLDGLLVVGSGEMAAVGGDGAGAGASNALSPTAAAAPAAGGGLALLPAGLVRPVVGGGAEQQSPGASSVGAAASPGAQASTEMVQALPAGAASFAALLGSPSSAVAFATACTSAVSEMCLWLERSADPCAGGDALACLSWQKQRAAASSGNAEQRAAAAFMGRVLFVLLAPGCGVAVPRLQALALLRQLWHALQALLTALCSSPGSPAAAAQSWLEALGKQRFFSVHGADVFQLACSLCS